MTIPDSFKRILDKDPEIAGIVLYTVSIYSKILEENKLYFFEEYTDHGIKHVNSVLNFSSKIIKEDTYYILEGSPRSIGLYILAVILHDLGMLITNEGLYLLITGKNDFIRVSEFDHKTWKQLWEDFLDKACRYGDKEKENIIGNRNWLFRVPPIENKDKLTGEDKKLIGEFIRMHHPRIAHEIAINGFPAFEGNLDFAMKLDYHSKNICGLLARSHGFEIRDTFAYLQDNFQDTWTKPHNIELIFLMVVLRIADYSQIDADRVKSIPFKLKAFHSPISQIEHHKHEDLLYLQEFHKDPETLIFHCEPRNSLVFINLKELLNRFQQELDKSWAILGEIYGRESKEKQPQIQYRRIRSNIDDIAKFSKLKQIQYIPEKVSFTISSDLSKLLIGPLYGDDPTYGIRELLQNAVDSCRQRAFLEGGSYEGIVSISFYKKQAETYFRIEDNGMGMSLDILKNYYLQIGSSFRSSTQWKRVFTDNKGSSKIQRSGKFGIGVLAAFLLGERIFLKTRNIESLTGLSFETSLDTEQIEIIKTSQESIGTIIEIPISKAVIESLKKSNIRFDKWYTQCSPKVIYDDQLNEFEELGYKTYAPDYYDELPDGWHELLQKDFNKIIWTFAGPNLQKNKDHQEYTKEKEHFLSYNGILIPEILNFSRRKMPFVSVFDFDNKLPLNLNRNGIDGDLPFEKELINDIHKEFLGKLLSFSLNSPFKNGLLVRPEKYSFFHLLDGDVPLLFRKSGFILNIPYFIKKNESQVLVEFILKNKDQIPEGFDSKNAFISLNKHANSLKNWLEKSNYKILADKIIYERAMSDIKNDFTHSYLRRANHDRPVVVNSIVDNVIQIVKDYDKHLFSLEDLAVCLKVSDCIVESTIGNHSGGFYFRLEESLKNILEIYLEGASIIPYEISERKKAFPKAFRELKHFIN